MRKYGEESFNIEAIYCSKDKKHTHKIMEPYFINEYQSHVKFKRGYNSTAGGDGVPDLSSKGRSKMGAYQLKTRNFISPAGEIFVVNRLADFCVEHSLSRRDMESVWIGKRYHCKGWRAYPIRKDNRWNYPTRIRKVWYCYCKDNTILKTRPMFCMVSGRVIKNKHDQRIKIMTPNGIALGLESAGKIMGVSRTTIFKRLNSNPAEYYRLN